MYRNQLQKIINDYSCEKVVLEQELNRMKIKEKALKSRLKLVKRKLVILTDKINKCADEIDWSANDFDDLDLFV